MNQLNHMKSHQNPQIFHRSETRVYLKKIIYGTTVPLNLNRKLFNYNLFQTDLLLQTQKSCFFFLRFYFTLFCSLLPSVPLLLQSNQLFSLNFLNNTRKRERDQILGANARRKDLHSLRQLALLTSFDILGHLFAFLFCLVN